MISEAREDVLSSQCSVLASLESGESPARQQKATCSPTDGWKLDGAVVGKLDRNVVLRAVFDIVGGV